MLKKVLHKVAFICLFYLLVMAVGTTLVYASSESSNEKGRVILVVLDRVSLQDLVNADMPNTMSLLNKGAVALMNSNPAGGAPRISPNTYATIGAGAKIQAGYAGGLAYNANEVEPVSRGQASQEYEVRTGIVAQKDSVLNLGIGEIWNLNKELKYDFVVGGLGTALHAAGLKTAVIGNSDTNDLDFRQGATIAMDSTGLVDFGDVSENTLVKDQDAVYRKRTDYNKVLGIYQKVKGQADFIVIDLGDTARLDQAAQSLLPEVLLNKKQYILNKYDHFIGSLVQKMNLTRDMLIIVSPGPSSAAMEERNYLTPVILAGKGFEKGFLVSPSTKRTGLINNVDIAPTVLSFFNLPMEIPFQENKVPLSGQALKFEKNEAPLETLLGMNSNIVSTYNVRNPLVKTFINTALILVIASAVGMYLGLGMVRYLKPLLLAITAMPLAMLLLYFFPFTSVFGIFIAAVMLTLLLAFVAYLAQRFFNNSRFVAFSLIGLATAAVIVVDTLAGGALNQNSPLSYDPMTGARFYGIGNEYMGVLLGALLMGMGTLPGSLTRTRKMIYLLIMLVTVFVMMAPNLGTNVGGTIAALIGFGTLILLIFDLKISVKSVLPIAFLLTGLFAAFLIYDTTRSPEAQSHIGRSVNLLINGGIEEVLQIISRKWEVNWRLIRGTSWSWTYFSSLIAIVLLKHWFRDTIRSLREEKLVYFKTLTGIIAASLGALFFNDSGVVAAAVMIVFTIPFLYLLIDHLKFEA